MSQEAKSKITLKLAVKKESGINYLKILGAGKLHGRSKTKITESSDVLKIEINANDLAALRASTNSILRDLQIIGATKLKTKKSSNAAH